MLTQKDYEAHVRSLREHKIILDLNPVERGLGYLLSKISEVQQSKNFAVNILIDAMQNKTEKEIILENLETEHKMEIQGLLATDTEVKGLKTADMRTSLANVKLAELALKVHHAKIDFMVADGFLSVVQHFYNNFQRITESLNQQITLVQLKYELNITENQKNGGS